jgi:hypothetical protein
MIQAGRLRLRPIMDDRPGGGRRHARRGKKLEARAGPQKESKSSEYIRQAF